MNFVKTRLKRRRATRRPAHSATGLSLAAILVLGVLAPRPAWAPVIPIPEHPVPGSTEVFFNEFGEDGSMCPGACGEGCPDNCSVEPFQRCHAEDPRFVVSGDAYTCGIHSACTALEDCKNACNNAPLTANDFLGVVFGIAPAHAPVVAVPPGEQPNFENGECLLACNQAARSAARPGLAGMTDVSGWSLGLGPYDSAATWEYTTEQPGGEVYKACGQCEKCENGGCVRDPEACPDNRPPPMPPLPPPLTTGDVHVTSLDGLRFDFQAVGEFVAFEDAAREIVLQLRTRAWGRWVSLTSAAAMRVNGDVVGFYADPSFTLLVNGNAAVLEDRTELALEQGGTIRRAANRYFVTWPDGTVVAVRNDTSNLGIFVDVAAGWGGKLRGIGGNHNGDRADDFVTRDGQALPSNPGHDRLYGEFANSWRITQDESLFVYGQGESTATFTLPDFPEKRVTLADLDPDAVAAAEAACAGIVHPRSYRDCVFDVAVTGDESFVAAHAGTAPPAAELPATYLEGGSAEGIEIAVPATASAGGSFPVTWSGSRYTGDFLAVAAPTDDALQYQTYRTVTTPGEVSLPAPAAPGNYVVRYVSGNGVAAEAPIEITEAQATLAAESEAGSGTTLTVTWTGPDNDRDYIAIATPDQPGNAQKSYVYTASGNPATLRVPDEPGEYEVRYIQHRSRTILAQRRLTVLPAEASLNAADNAHSGGTLEVTWTGPDNYRDYIAIATPDQPGNAQKAYAYTSNGSPATLRVPDEPGAYEIRYIQDQSRTVLASRELTVLAVDASVSAATEAGSGSTLEVTWTGPDNDRDYIAIATPDQPGNAQKSYAYTSGGSPATLRVPDEPGPYEVRYIQDQSRTILASQAFTVLPAEASLDAASEAVAGGELIVTWTGPDNDRDYIAIATPDQPGNTQKTYAYTSQGSPATVRVPNEPGEYELRYIQGQSRTVLARQALTVRAE